jgi:CheY-like chemotaxis protein
MTEKPVVLVVEDDEAVMGVIVKVLEHFGYTVLRAFSVFAALDILSGADTDLDFVILDFHVGNHTSEVLLPELRSRGIRFALFSANWALEDDSGLLGVSIWRKPDEIMNLSRLITEARAAD